MKSCLQDVTNSTRDGRDRQTYIANIRHRVATFPRSLPSVILRWRGKKNVGESLNLCQLERNATLL